MKSTFKKKIIMFTSPLLILGGCSSSDAPSSVNLEIQGTAKSSLSSLSTLALVDAAAVASKTIDLKDAAGAVIGSLTINNAKVSLKRISFSARERHQEGADNDASQGADNDNGGSEVESDGEADETLAFNGPYVVDLIADTVTPSLGLSQLPSGIYKEIKLELDKIEGDEEDEAGAPVVDASDPLFGHSIYIEGTYTGPSSTGAQVDAAFSMSFDLDESFELTGLNNTSSGVDVAAEKVNVIIAFRMQKWFAFNNAETNSGGTLNPAQLVFQGGTLTLDESAAGDNASIRHMIKENIKKSADYGEDKDHDGKLSREEDDDLDSEDNDDD